MPADVLKNLAIDWVDVAEYCRRHLRATLEASVDTGTLYIEGEPETVSAAKRHVDLVLQKAFTASEDVASTNRASEDAATGDRATSVINRASDDDSVQLDDSFDSEDEGDGGAGESQMVLALE